MAWLRAGTAPLLPSIGRSLLRRRFPVLARCRILLAYQDDALAYPQFAPFLRYAKRFAAHGIYFRAMPYFELHASRLPRDIDAVFVQSSYTPAPGELERLFSSLQQARPTLRIVYFDWFAPSDVRFADRVNPWTSAYVKKSLLRDRSLYLRPSIGHTNLSDHFSARLQTENPHRGWTVPPGILPKLVVGPSFSTSPALVGRFEKALPADAARPIDLHARIATRGTPWYAAMREEASAAVAAYFPDLRVASQGMVAKSRYMRELQQSKLCFSPFGYGEVCWRDFEAIAVGTVVVKPDMGHLETNPNIYIPFETYIPVRWDLADLDVRVREALSDRSRLRGMAIKAFDVVRDHLRGPSLVDFAIQLVSNEISSLE